MDDGTALALTPDGLVAYVSGGHVSALKGSGLVIGALSPDKTTVAIGSSAARSTDLYRIAPKSFALTFIGSISLDATALAFSDTSTLLILTKDGTLSRYSIPATGSPSLVATTTLPNPWP
jgi:hypothetical protein